MAYSVAANPQYQYVVLSATGVVRAAPGILSGFMVASGTPTVALWDNATGATNPVILTTMQTAVGIWYGLPVRFVNGLWAVITGTGSITFATVPDGMTNSGLNQG